MLESFRMELIFFKRRIIKIIMLVYNKNRTFNLILFKLIMIFHRRKINFSFP